MAIKTYELYNHVMPYYTYISIVPLSYETENVLENKGIKSEAALEALLHAGILQRGMNSFKFSSKKKELIEFRIYGLHFYAIFAFKSWNIVCSATMLERSEIAKFRYLHHSSHFNDVFDSWGIGTAEYILSSEHYATAFPE